MKTRATLLVGCLALVGVVNLSAVDIAGKVQGASGDVAVITVEGDALPSVGDKLSIFFKMDGLDEEIAVGSGTVTAVSPDGIKAQIDEATGTVAKDQLVRIISDTPSKKSAAAPPPPMVPPLPTPTVTPETSTPEPSVAEATSKEISFDDLPLGALGENALSRSGLRVEARKGAPEIFAAQPNMLLPSRRRKVMLVGGGPVTSISIVFDQPVKRFTLHRVGTAKGASTPTWTMTAYNGSGKSVDTTGETHGLPPKPRSFAVAGKGITRVQIGSDNRHGTGTWATWNSLPMAGFRIER